MQGCDYRPEVQRWARYYTDDARAFVASWKQALPFLLLVADQVEQRDLPGDGERQAPPDRLRQVSRGPNVHVLILPAKFRGSTSSAAAGNPPPAQLIRA